MSTLFSKTVLVAEDETFMRRVLIVALERMGARVIDCADGKQALAALNDPQRIDLALLDVLMPEMHGLHVLKEIRSSGTYQDYAMPVALLTATQDEASVHYAAELSCDGFILKPIGQAGLAERLDRMMKRRMTMPYKPPHYRKIDVGPPDEPPRMPVLAKPEPDPEILPPPPPMVYGVSSLRIGMMFAAPLAAHGKVIVPEGTMVTRELLVLLLDLDRVKSLGPVEVSIP